MFEKSMDQIRREECEYLQTMPSRINQLTDALLAATFPDDTAWCGDLVLKLMQSVARVGHDLLTATESPDALPLVAWNARNMVELAVWIRYCGRSPENARRFHEDTLRDLKGLIDSLAELHRLVGATYELEQTAHAGLNQLAQEKLGLESIDANYERVSSAAKNVGWSNWYIPVNKFLSKLAHPTAILVIGIMHQTDFLRDMQSGCLMHGTQAARFCEEGLQRFVGGLVSRGTSENC
jgi:hypothetical protein